MAAECSSNSSLPWLWIIEFLAGLKEVDASLLQEMIKRTPEFSDDLGKNAREMVSLRCLEGLFISSSDEITDPNPSTDVDSKIKFDHSERIEDVFQRILDEMSLANLKVGGPELEKYDVHPFVMHKKTSLRKNALQQLKETILDGTHPSSAFLMERSGLVPINRCDRRNPMDKNNAESEKGNSAPLTSENLIEPLQGVSSARPSILSKRDRSNLGRENLVERLHQNRMIVNDGGDLRIHAKKLVQGSSSLVPHHENKLQGTKGNDNDDPDDVTLHKISQGTSADQPSYHNIFVNEVMEESENGIELNTSEGALLDETCQKNFDEAKGHTDKSDHNLFNNVVDDDSSSDGEEYNYHKKIDITGTKYSFLNSQFTCSQQFTEQNVCMKCNKDGLLLVCSTSMCPLMVHESCLGSIASFDEKGDFYCPFCAYSVAISEYRKSKKKAALARKGLAEFIGGGIEEGEKEPKVICREVMNQKAENGNGHIKERKNNEGRQKNQVQADRESDNDVDLEEISEDSDKVNASNYFIRFRKQKQQYTYPRIPMLRRKKLAWTAQEETVLKEGVQRFSSEADKWKKILEFGGGVFQKGRTTIDLKDKWRNICRGSPNPKLPK